VNEIEFIYPLSPDLQDRLRVKAIKNKGRIVSFVVQYEALIKVAGVRSSDMTLPIGLPIGTYCIQAVPWISSLSTFQA
jgi:hypothetical protein